MHTDQILISVQVMNAGILSVRLSVRHTLHCNKTATPRITKFSSWAAQGL